MNDGIKLNILITIWLKDVFFFFFSERNIRSQLMWYAKLEKIVIY